MSSEAKDLGLVSAGGAPREIGRALGRAGGRAVRERLTALPVWRAATGPENAAAVARMAEGTARRFPAILEEIEGLAEGLDLPFEQVMAWNCRGDLLPSSPDGCTTVQLPGPEPVIGHNEDGLPCLRGHCFMAEVAPADGAGFTAFCYPGSLPGHTFAVTEDGLAQAVNNLRLPGAKAAVPRMVIGRAVLAAGGLDAALALLAEVPASGGFHFTLAEAGSARLVSVEFGRGESAVREVAAPALHANHALFLPGGLAAQVVTRSSADRQARGEALIAGGARDPLAILRDTGGPGLPIRRDAPDDPDCENTLATAIMHVRPEGVEWSIYDRISEGPAYRRG